MSNEFTEMAFTEALTNIFNNDGKLSFMVDTRVSVRYDVMMTMMKLSLG